MPRGKISPTPNTLSKIFSFVIASPLCLDIALMKYCRFELNGSTHYGLVESVAGNDEITRLLLQPPQDSRGAGIPTRRVDRIPLAQASLLPPVQPSKIVCVGRNYREHAAELGHPIPQEPLLFFKPPSALLPPGATILRPEASAQNLSADSRKELRKIFERFYGNPV